MTQISHTAEIEVHASVDEAFAVIADDIVGVEDGSAEMTRHRPLDEGPLRVGFRWRQTGVHDRSVCRTDWVVTELREPWVLEQAMEHLCLAARREVVGGERWQFEETGEGATLVTLRAWRQRAGLGGWLERLLGSLDDARGVSLRKRLTYVQFRAERGSPRPA